MVMYALNAEARDFAKAVLIKERIMKQTKGEALAEGLVREFRDTRRTQDW